jgi:hypothetical protein
LRERPARRSARPRGEARAALLGDALEQRPALAKVEERLHLPRLHERQRRKAAPVRVEPAPRSLLGRVAQLRARLARRRGAAAARAGRR